MATKKTATTPATPAKPKTIKVKFAVAVKDGRYEVSGTNATYTSDEEVEDYLKDEVGSRTPEITWVELELPLPEPKPVLKAFVV